MPTPKNIVWLASYPKSGNTWLRFFLASLMYGAQSSAEVIEAIGEIGSPEQISQELLELNCDIIVKTHLLHDFQLPVATSTAAFIYIIRNPLDVMLSNYNYHLSRIGNHITSSGEEYKRIYYNNYLDSQGDPNWIKLGFGTWHENLSSWLVTAKGKFPSLTLKYEDMLEDTMKIARKINEFLVLNKSNNDLQAALNFSSFENMKHIEKAELKNNQAGFFKTQQVEQGEGKNHCFLGQGIAGRGMKELPGDILEEALSMFKTPLKQFGYIK